MRTASLAFAFLFCLPLLSSTAHQVDPCERYLRDFWSITYFEPTSYWRSANLRNVPLRDLPNGAERGKAIAKAFFNRGSFISSETLYQMPQWVATARDPIKTVMRATELFNYTRDAATEARSLDSLIDGDARILQVGGGSGWLAGYLAQQSPLRRIDVMEAYGETIDLAKRRLRVLLPLASMPTFMRGLMNSRLELPDNCYDAMIVQRTYYRLGESTRAAFFARAYDALKDDAFSRLILIEPIAGRQDLILPLTLNAIEQAVNKGAPHTEFDVAIVAMLMAGVLPQGLTGIAMPAPQPVLPLEVIRQAERVGFVLQSRAPSPDGLSDFFIFGKR